MFTESEEKKNGIGNGGVNEGGTEPLDYAAACAYFDDLVHNAKKRSHDHTRECLRRLGDPEKNFRCIQVVGTNGKGSVCAFLSSVFRGCGIRTGVFTSPHLVSVRERISIDGREISEEEFASVFSEVLKVSREMEAEGFGRPAFFEFLFLMAMVWFAGNGVKTAVIEAGLGGGRDTTSVLTDPYLYVITSVSRDHEKYLGTTIPEIAAEKAGILKPSVPLVFDGHDQEAARVIEKRAEELSCRAVRVPDDWMSLEAADASGITCRLPGRFEGETALYVPIPAPYQRMNASCAVAACDVLKETYPDVFSGLSDERIREGIASAFWPCRMERVGNDVYVDGAHNVAGIRAFSEAAKVVAGGRPYGLLFAVSMDKNYPEMIGILCANLKPEFVVATEIPNKRRAPANHTADLFREFGVKHVEAVPDAAEALEAAQRLKGKGVLFCAGSLFLAGSLIETLRRNGS